MVMPIIVSEEVRAALKSGAPIVALESALITHGFAYPANVEITHQMAEIIRAGGALPAVIGVWEGRPTVGLSAAQIEGLAHETAVKISIRDLSLARLRGLHGGTTVAATMLLAQRVGLHVFATGGIGGVHRGHPEDISADLPALATIPVIVVCAGAKAILDLPRTLEFLETWGVPVLGWQTASFPAFYSRESGLAIDQRVSNAAEVAAIYASQRALELPQGLLVTAPVPAEDELPAQEIEPLIAQALAEMNAQGISGKHVTPYLLARLVTLSDARSRRANESLLLNNAHVGAQIAVQFASQTAAQA
ncbi:MAG: pseudouridine-5'-phosphate glycosidase [Anaerolineae bacterium]|jgi:pseudouridine-5'-phosphate glycosidase|nr:pseudouridine-5'-phosphate glycosidase [Anaerolineae bacterium]